MMIIGFLVDFVIRGIALLIGFTGAIYLAMGLLSVQNGAIVHHGPNHQIIQDLKAAAKSAVAPGSGQSTLPATELRAMPPAQSAPVHEGPMQHKH